MLSDRCVVARYLTVELIERVNPDWEEQLLYG